MRRKISSQLSGSYTNRIRCPNYQVLLALLLLFGMSAASSSCARSDVQEESSPPVVRGESDIWFDDIDADQMLSPVAGELIARYVTNRIFEGAGNEEALGTLLDDKALRIIFISVSDGNSTSKVFMGRGKGVIEAVEDALFELDALQQGAFPVKHVKIDVVQSAYNTSVADPRVSLDETYERDLFGLAFDHQTGLAYLPGEILGHTLIDSDRHLRFDNMADYAAISQKPVDEIQNLSSASDLDITRFSSLSYYSDGEEIIGLYRNHRFFGQLDPNDLLSAAISGANYLKESVGPDGKFVYSYFPKSDTEKDDYNILRHAGTIYAMLEVFEYTQDPELLVSIEHAIEYLLTKAQACGDDNEAATCIVEEGESKLGGNGLAIVALAKYTELTGNEEYYPLMTSLANWILSVQSDAGEFTVHKLDHETGVAADFTSDYYPGEALLALMRLYALDGDPTWLEAADKGAEWLITVRDGEVPVSDLQHDHWLLYALNEIYRHSPRDIFIEHVFRITDAIIAAQNRNPAYPDWRGSYYDPPRSTPTATRSEGLFSAYLLARDYGYIERAAEILETLRLNISFQMQTQFRPESVMYLIDPQRSLGGFHKGLDNYELRIDYTQHNISSLLGLYKILTASPVQ